MSRRSSRATWAALGLIMLAQLVLLVWHDTRATVQPHRVPVAIQGPSFVAQDVARRLNRLPGEISVTVSYGAQPSSWASPMRSPPGPRM